MNSKAFNSSLLVLTALIWGTAFVAQSKGGDALGAYTFNCLRSFIGFLVIIPVILTLDKFGIGIKPKTKPEKKKLLIGGIACGAALCVASNLQQLGITLGTPVGKAGFLTSLYIILVPVAGMFFGKKCPLYIWIGVALSLIGLYMLCISDGFSLQNSDILLILCAVGFTVQIMLISIMAPQLDPVRMSCIQFLTCGILSMIPMFFVDMQHSAAGIAAWLPAFASSDAWGSLLFAGIFSSGVAYTLQIVAQRNLNPTIASMIFSLESVFSVLAGWLILHERLSTRELLGCLLIFAAVILSQLPDKKSTDNKINKEG